MQILDELEMNESFLSCFGEIELKLRNIFESLHLILKMFERKHCQLVKDQLSRYSIEVDQILKQMSDNLMSHNEEIKTLPDVVSSHFNVLLAEISIHMTNIRLLTYSLNILTSVDLRPKESLKDFLNKCFMKMTCEFDNNFCYSHAFKY